MPELLVDHFESVGVEPKLAVRVEIIEELPVDNDVLTSHIRAERFKVVTVLWLLGSFLDGDVVEIHLELDELRDL